jgi:DNA-binding SARP family transcriptional activator
MRLDARRGLLESALEYGRRILAVDALREGVQREVMLLLVLNGQRAEAIHTYHRLRAALKRDLGIEPMPETKRLADDIRSGAIFDRLGEYVRVQFASSPAPLA